MPDKSGAQAAPTVAFVSNDDAESVVGALAGDLRAFDRLIERYQRRAMSVAYRLLGNVQDAADVCQEAFLRAYRSLESLQEPGRFGAWLLRIVSNQALNYRRGRRSNLSLAQGERNESETGEVGGYVAATPEHEQPATAMMSAELEERISRAVESLPEKQRMALLLFAVEGMPQKEVADILEMSIESVKWNVFQARKTLKDLLADDLTE